MGGCSRCESLAPYTLSEKMFLHITTPTGHTFTKLKRGLEHDFKMAVRANGYLYIELSSEEYPSFANALEKLLSKQELHDSYLMVLSEDNSSISPIEALKATQSLATFSGIASAQWLVQLIQGGHLTCWFQPIVASATHEIYAHECLLRAHDNDEVIGAQTILSAAKSADMLFLVDRQARITSIYQSSNYKGQLKRLFINFNPTSIYDPQFCLRTTDDAVKDAGLTAEQIVFEITESEFVEDKTHLLHITDFYRERGYQIALDDLGSGYSSLNMLHELRPDFVKLDMDLIRNIHQSDIKQIMIEKIVEIAIQLDIKTVAEGIESQSELECLKRFPIDFYQGYYFGKPAAIPSNETAHR